MSEEFKKDKTGKFACAGMGGGLGLAALAGACSAGCGVAVAPLVALLSSVGLGSVASFLPGVRIPLIVISALLGAYSIGMYLRRKNGFAAAICGCALGMGGALVAWQSLQANECQSASTMEKVLKKLSPQSKMVLQKGIYSLWPELGRPPTVEEIRQRLGLESTKPVLQAFRELEGMGFNSVLYPGTNTIKWLWPLSSLDHGVEVTLAGLKTVHARCAIDALGMSDMFGKTAEISIKSPLDSRHLELEVRGHDILKATPGILVTHGDSCDSTLFFSSRDEYDRYLKKSGSSNLPILTLQEGLERGIWSFGRTLKI